MVYSSARYIDAVKLTLPDWNVVTNEDYGRVVGVGIEKHINGEFVRQAWRVDDHTPDDIAAAARDWVNGL